MGGKKNVNKSKANEKKKAGSEKKVSIEINNLLKVFVYVD